MTASVLRDRRSGASRRKHEASMRFPFFDRYGQIVLWDRRKQSGRRKADERKPWSKKDLPGFILMAVMFVVLSLGLVYLWISKPVFAAQGITHGRAVYAQAVVPGTSIGLRAIKALLDY